jgi:exopolysaccharide production protein ExoQ
MPPLGALILWFVLLVSLFVRDPAKDERISATLWVPLTWMFFVGSRLPAQWLGGYVGSAAQSLEEGNPLDRAVFSALIILAIVILLKRSFRWDTFITRNLALIGLLAFAAVSVVWSDFPLIALKRWLRDLGNYLMILVVLSDRYPLEAAIILLRRLCYLLIPLSVLVCKYYPQIGKQYDQWTGLQMFVGATTSKNMLGVLCLVSALFFFWDIVRRWTDRKDRQTRKIILVNVAFVGMTLWLLNLSNSATSTVCTVLGFIIIFAAHTKPFKRHPALLKFLMPACFCLYLILAFGFQINGELAKGVGRDPTLTGRSNIWNAVLSTKTNPIVGTGYESFWLGSRLKQVWRLAGPVNEAHNGYLELYLNLGLIGIFLLFIFLVASFRTICKKLSSLELASLGLALWTVLLFYNMTESAAFKGQLLWVIFLIVMVTISADVPVAHEVSAITGSAYESYQWPIQHGVSRGDHARPQASRGERAIVRRSI